MEIYLLLIKFIFEFIEICKVVIFWLKLYLFFRQSSVSGL